MTTGAPIYLVSACASGEEFISAFRRYADRNGVVFIPISAPLPPGRKGRFALTLKNGGVMVEGEAEVVSSARTPSVLYGRVGMTLKFTEPDEPSKTLLGELEKARLQMKPTPPSVAPRPAEIPAEPRPTPPTPSGRIDAVNALAECVVIGDLSTLTSDDGPKGLKFTVPSIPPVAGRPKSPSVPGPPLLPTTMGMPPLKGQSPVLPRQPTPASAVPIAAPPRAPTPATALPVVGKATVMGMPALEKAPASGPVPAPLPVPAPPPPVVAAKETVMGMQALGKAPVELTADPTMPTPAKVAAAAAASREKAEALQTVRGPAPGVDLIARGKTIDANETMRGPAPKVPTATSTPPRGTAPPPFVPRQPTPPVPTPIVAPPPLVIAPPPPILTPAPPVVAVALPVDNSIDDADEPTDLTELPLVPVEQVASELSGPERSVREPRKTVIGIAVVPSGVHVLPAAPARRVPSHEESRDTSVMEAQSDEASGPVMITSMPPTKEVVDVDALGATQPAAARFPSAVMNATVEEATPSGDWTMTPGEHGPTIAPRAPTPVPVALAKPRVQTADPEENASINQIPAGPQTGDWMIALDPSQPDGWSEPSRVEKRPEGVLPPEQAGPPVSTVASAKDLDSNAKVAPEPKLPDAAKVEVDPTLMEPLQPLQPIDDFDDEPQLPPPPSASMPAMTGLEVPTGGQMHTPLPHIPAPLPMPGQIQLANSSGQVQAYPMDPAQLQMGQPRGVTDAGTGFFRDTNEVPRYPTDSPPAITDEGAAARKRRLIVIIASAGVALLLVVILAMVLGGGTKKSGDDEPKGSDTADHSVTNPTQPPKQPDPPKGDGGSGSAQKAVVNPTTPPDATEAIVQPAPPDAPQQIAPATECEVEFSSAPQGADIVLDKDVVGTTPAKLKLPCGVESRLTFKKQRFVSAQRAVTPKSTGQKPVRIALAKVTFIVKVSSSPPGAMIFLGAKSLGITPAAVKLPAFEASTLKITKDGYAPDLQKVTPKTNNLSISSILKKLPPKKLR